MFAIFEWAWIAVAILVLVFGFCIIKAEIREGDYYDGFPDGWAIFCFLGILGLLQFATPVDPKTWLLNNYIPFLIYSIIYLTVGFSWSIFKWFRFVRKNYKKYSEDKARWAKDGSYLELKDYLPDPSKNKNRIIRWILAWPVSVFWASTCDFLVWIGEKIYNLAGEIYKKIVSTIFADFIKEDEIEKEKKKREQVQRKLETEAFKQKAKGVWNDRTT